MDAFAKALLVIPKTLAVNGAYDATDLVAKLRAYHHAAQTDPTKAKFKYTGLDLENGMVVSCALSPLLNVYLICFFRFSPLFVLFLFGGLQAKFVIT